MKTINCNFKKKFGFIAILCLIFSSFILVDFIQESLKPMVVTATETKDYVIDDANVLSDIEEDQLEKLCKTASDSVNCDIVIITFSYGYDGSVMDKYVRNILETEYGFNGSGSNCDACAYAIDMTSRADRIVTSGVAKSSISQSKLDSIREKAESKLANGNYYGGCSKFVNGIKAAIIDGTHVPTTKEKLSEHFAIKLLIALFAATIITFIAVSNAKAKTTTTDMTYVKNHKYNVNAREDVFINTTVTKRKIERSSSSSGGGSFGGGNSGSSGGHF